MTNSAFVSESRFRVRFAETDAMGIVHHASYIIWMEQARTDYCRAAGMPYSEISAQGIDFMVTDIGVKYLSPSFFDDQIVVRAWVEKVGRASCRFGYQLYNETTGKIGIEGFSEHAAAGRDGKVKRLFPELYQLLTEKAGIGVETSFNRVKKEKTR
jgi:acyl-CoA thioester hydrolase